MDLVGRGLTAVRGELQLFGDLLELAVNVLPLTDAQVMQELRLTELAELVGGELLLLLFDVVPQLQPRQEVRALLLEARVLLRGSLLLVRGALAWVLDGQRGGDDEDLLQRAVAVRLQDHAAELGVHRELRELAADRRQALAGVLLLRVERAELVEQVHAVADVAGVRRVQERERGDVAEAQRAHLQDDGRQGGTQDLGLGELWAGQEVVLGVQPDADAVAGAAAAALALVRRGLRHRLDRQALHLGAVAVAGDARGTRVDHIADTRDGETGLGDVGCQDDAAAGVGFEDLVLLGGTETRVEGDDLCGAQVPLLKGIRRIADLALSR